VEPENGKWVMGCGYAVMSLGVIFWLLFILAVILVIL
jgi:hypothetical protein